MQPTRPPRRITTNTRAARLDGRRRRAIIVLKVPTVLARFRLGCHVDEAKILEMTELHGSAQIQFATPSELCLLRAALLEGPLAGEALESWLASLRDEEIARGFSGLGSASRRLLPLVYRNAKAFIPPHLKDAIRLIHHEYWAANQKHLNHLQELLAWFEQKGIPTMVLKGMALSVLHYRDMALRPMSDLDIMVPEDRAPEVIGWFQREGWSSLYYRANAPRNPYFRRHTHAFPLEDPHYGILDLHWHALAEATFEGADLPFWSDSVELAVNKIRSRALNPTDQLMHACVHGFTANAQPPIRWVADAVMVLRSSDVDWTRLLTLASELHVTVPLGSCLSFLRATFQAPIPEQVVRQLQAVLVDHAERRYFETLVHQNADWREVLAYNLERNRRANRDRNPLVGIGSLPLQLQLHYGLPNLKDLGSFAFSRLKRRIHKRIGSS